MTGNQLSRSSTFYKKNFQENHTNSWRFPGFPGGFLNSNRFPEFPGVVDTLHYLTKIISHSKLYTKKSKRRIGTQTALTGITAITSFKNICMTANTSILQEHNANFRKKKIWQ